MAPPHEKERLLDLAARQGVLSGDQIVPSAAGACGEVIAALLARKAVHLEPLRLSPGQTPSIAELDPWQREALARALHTPDVFLLQGLPGVGKSRLLAHLTCQATTRGERVLLAAPGTAALDRVLEQLPQQPHLCPLRLLDPGERLEDLPPRIRRMVPEERVRVFEEETLPQARQAVEAGQQLLADRQGDQAIWGRISDLTDQAERLAAQLDQARQKRAALPEQVHQWKRNEAGPSQGPLAEQLSACRHRHEHALARIAEQLADLKRRQEEAASQSRTLTEENLRLQALARVSQTYQVWNPGWWRARFEKDLPGQLHTVAGQMEDLDRAGEQIRKQTDALVREQGQARARLEEECAALYEEEARRQGQQLDDELASLEGELERVKDKWSQLCRQLSGGVEPPAGIARIPLEQARRSWERRAAEDELQLTTARKWRDQLEASAPTFPEEVQRLANVRAATIATLLTPDPGQQEPALHDLVIVEEAERLTEVEVLRLAGRARRIVLVGRAPLSPPGDCSDGHAIHPHAFRRLWDQLHPAPSELPYRWFSEGEGLTCILHEITPSQERWVQRERLADRPEIELIFLVPHGEAPYLAEVHFPVATSIVQAKEYLFRELDELPIQASLPDVRWEESETEIRVHLSAAAEQETAARIPLSAGVQEEVLPRPWNGSGQGPGQVWLTRALAFERSAGWTREKAEEWIEEHLRLPMTGRSALLRVPHRMQPPLACWLSDFLFAGDYAGTQPHQQHELSPVSFLAVPPLEPDKKDRRQGASRWKGSGPTTLTPRLRALKGGAGLELDLGRRARVDQQLPADLRGQLPDQGLVNYLEAQAIIAYVEELVRTPAFCQAARRWQMEHPLCLEGKGIYDGLRQPNLALIALYPAQVALLQLLLEQSPARACGPVIEVGLPDAFRQRECQQVVLGLTRSHASRAVAYEPYPGLLAEALCLACERLVLVGDPGTLVRRSGWVGAVDHQGPIQARYERGLMLRLVAYLEGQGDHPTMFQLQESCRV